MADKLRLKGKVSWTNRLFNPETYTGPDGRTETSWSVLFYPDDNQVDVLYDLQRQGMKNVIGRDPERGFSIRFKRHTQKKMRGEVVAFEPPKVADSKGMPWDSNVMIPNGSEAFVDISVYSHNIPGSTTGKKAKAVRLEGAQIISLADSGMQPQGDNNAVKGEAERVA